MYSYNAKLYIYSNCNISYLGLMSPSSYAGARSLVKALMDLPYSGKSRLLHQPVKVRYLKSFEREMKPFVLYNYVFP